MLTFLLFAAAFIWAFQRTRLWRMIFNVRREIRSAVRKRRFGRYYVAIRWRELLFFFGYVLWIATATLAEDGYALIHQGGRWLLAALYAVAGFYALFLIVDGLRLRRRFRRLVARWSGNRARSTAARAGTIR